MARLPTTKRKSHAARARFTEEYGILLEILIELRMKAGLTQQQMAELVGKSQAHVSLWERREREISVIDVWRWCGAVGMTTSQFFILFERRLSEGPLKKS